jgi:radical SAM protein with 4Fe4S-binding SPASM domain
MSSFELYKDDIDFEHLFYLRIFEGCNLHCEHCYIPSNPKKMTHEQFTQVPEVMLSKIPEDSRVYIQWHGGEPTALGRDYLEKAILAVEEAAAGRLQIRHGIQTNLISFDESWVDFYRKYFDGKVGVSWDYQIRLMRKGKPRTNAEYEKIFWDKMNQLVAAGLKPYVVTTATRVFFERFKSPYEFFDLMLSHGVIHVHLERVTKTGYARENWKELGISNREYSDYMARFAKFYYMHRKNEGEEAIHLSPFDGLFDTVSKLIVEKLDHGYGCWSDKCDSNFHTIDANGYKAGCTAINSEYDNRYFEKKGGEVVIHFSNIQKARQTRIDSCGECEFSSICNTGCMVVDKFDVTDECSGGSRLFAAVKNLIM